MADQKWKDWRTIQSLLSDLDTTLQNVKIQIAALEQFKISVFDDPARKASLKLLVDLDPDWTMEMLQDLYAKYRAIGNWLETNG